MKPIQFGNETIYVRELTYAEFENFSHSVIDITEDPVAWRNQQIDLMVRYAVRKDGTRRFNDRNELDGVFAKDVLKAAYAFTFAFNDLHLVTADEIDEMRKN